MESIDKYLIVLVTISALHVFVVASVLKSSSRRLLNTIFSLFIFSIITWNIFNYLAVNTNILSTRLWFVKIVLFFAVVQVTLFYLLSRTIYQRAKTISKKTLAPFIVLSTITALSTLTPYVFEDLHQGTGNSVGVAIVGPGIYLFGFTVTMYLVLGFIQLFRSIRDTERQIIWANLYVFVGAIIMYVSIFSLNFILPIIFNNSAYIPLAPLLTIPLALTITYAILRYGALGAGITISSSILYFVSTTGVLITASYFFWTFKHKIFSSYELLPQISVIVLLGLISYYLFDFIFDRFLKKHNQPVPFKKFTNTKDFLNILNKKYYLSWSIWTQSDKKPIHINQPTSSRNRALKVLQKINRRMHKNIILSLNPIDSSSRVLHKLRASVLDDSGPERISIVIRTEQGTFLAGHKKYNFSFTEQELKLLLHEVNLHKAQLEIEEIKAARANHVHELETLREKKRESLEKANSKLKDNLQKRAAFFHNVATELRTPLTIVQAAVQDNTLKLNQFNLSLLGNSTRRLLALTEELKSTGGNNISTIKNEIVSLKNITALLKNRYINTPYPQKIDLKFFVTPPDAKIFIKPTHLEQILDNLISNAIKYSPAHSEVIVYLKAFPGRLLIQVLDQGPGIKESEKNLIFEPFYRTQATSHIKGTGLGLSTVKRLANLYQGKALASNRSEGGSIFEIDLNIRTDIHQAHD